MGKLFEGKQYQFEYPNYATAAALTRICDFASSKPERVRLAAYRFRLSEFLQNDGQKFPELLNGTDMYLFIRRMGKLDRRAE